MKHLIFLISLTTSIAAADTNDILRISYTNPPPGVELDMEQIMLIPAYVIMYDSKTNERVIFASMEFDAYHIDHDNNTTTAKNPRFTIYSADKITFKEQADGSIEMTSHNTRELPAILFPDKSKRFSRAMCFAPLRPHTINHNDIIRYNSWVMTADEMLDKYPVVGKK